MKSVYLLLALLGSAPAFAQEAPPAFETVVEDVVFNTSSRTVIDEKAIKDSRAPNITTLLSSQANITITNTPFQPNSIFIRGGDSSHILILVDGVPFYDASTVQRNFNLNSLDIKSVRRIEIIKGSQTVLYGGQALSGVIKIDTIPQEFDEKTMLKGHVGNYNARDFSLAHTEKISDNQGVLFRGQGSWKDIRSPVLGSSEAYPRDSWNGEAAYAWKGAVDGHIKGHYIQERNMSANSSYATLKTFDTKDFEQYNRQAAVSSVLKFNELPWTPRLSFNAHNSFKTYEQPVNATNTTLTDYKYGANLRSVRLDVSPLRSSTFDIDAGLSYNYENFNFRDKGSEIANASSEQMGAFVKADWKAHSDFVLSAGVRSEKWDTRNGVESYQAGITLFEKTKFEYASGHKTPSLFQLYSNYGNPNLESEKANVYSLTQELDLSERQQVSLTAFVSNYSGLITTVGTPPNTKYANVNRAESRGAELVYTLRPTDDSSLLLTYGYQEPRDMDKDRWLLRRPLTNGSIKYTHTWGSHTGSVEAVGAGERLDTTGPGGLIQSIPGYATGNIAYSYDWDRSLTLYTRLNNILDYRYQEVYSYYSEGFTGVVGAEYWF